MRIAFWSEQEDAGTSFNLAVVASAAVCMYPISAAVVSGGYHDKKLEKKFFRPGESAPVFEDAADAYGQKAALAAETHKYGQEAALVAETHKYGQEAALAAETREFFLCGGLDSLLCKERHELTEETVKGSMRQIVKDRMFYLPTSVRQDYEWWHMDHQFERMDRIMDAVESCFDIVFIDCGNRRDDYAKKLFLDADICVLNMHQRAEVIGAFCSHPLDIRGEIFFLIGKYFEGDLYNRKNLQRIYRIDDNRLGAIPFDPYLHAADQMGRIKNGVGGYVHDDGNMHTEFEKELVRTTNLILRLAGVIA